MAGVSGGLPAVPIVALDFSDCAEALELVDHLGDRCRFYKIGSELFTRNGPKCVAEVVDRGCDVFLDLKFHDIPNTVAKGARSAARLGVRLLTVHASGGRAMLEAARDGAADGGDCGVLAVTVLTSLDAPALAAAWGREHVDVRQEVLRLAGTAADAGLHGIVCSGQEAAAVRAAHGDRLALLVPGIRLAGGATQDQARVVTPRAAVESGARYLVLGRAVTAADDPRAAMERVLDELRAHD
jgi:orotidine-5'-phosphate decarboxylase